MQDAIYHICGKICLKKRLKKQELLLMKFREKYFKTVIKL